LDSKGQMSLVGWVLSTWLLSSTALALGTVPGGWLLEATGTSEDIGGYVNDVWLPFGTYTDIAGVRFKIIGTKEGEVTKVALSQAGVIKDKKDLVSGVLLEGNNVQVEIKDWYFINDDGRTNGGQFLADIKVNPPSMSLTRPIFFRKELAITAVDVSEVYKSGLRVVNHEEKAGVDGTKSRITVTLMNVSGTLKSVIVFVGWGLSGAPSVEIDGNEVTLSSKPTEEKSAIIGTGTMTFVFEINEIYDKAIVGWYEKTTGAKVLYNVSLDAPKISITPTTETESSIVETADTTVEDTIPPTIVSASPTGSNVSLTEAVEVSFDESMDTSVEPTISVVSGFDRGGWSGSWIDEDTFRWTHEPFSSGYYYTLKITGYRDKAGNVGPEHTINFSTSAKTPHSISLVSPTGTISKDYGDSFTIKAKCKAGSDIPVEFSNFRIKTYSGGSEVSGVLDVTNWSFNNISLSSKGEDATVEATVKVTTEGRFGISVKVLADAQGETFETSTFTLNIRSIVNTTDEPGGDADTSREIQEFVSSDQLQTALSQYDAIAQGRFEDVKTYIDSQIENITGVFRDALESYKEWLIQKEEADNIWRLQLTKPHITINAPFGFNAGIPNPLSIDLQNAVIKEVKISDASGVLFAGESSFLNFTPIEGSFVSVEVTAEPSEAAKLAGWTEDISVTKTIPVLFSQSYSMSLTEDTSVGSTEYEYGWTVLHIIVISGVGILSLILVIKLYERRRR